MMTSSKLADWSKRVGAMFAFGLCVALIPLSFYLGAKALSILWLLLLVSYSIGAAFAALLGVVLGPTMGFSRLATGSGAAAMTVIIVGIPTAWLALSSPPRLGAAEPDPRGPHQNWVLATGSRLAVWPLYGEGVRRRTPILVIHGGPGEFTPASLMHYGAPLRAAGFDTIYFDQAGVGASDLIPISEYTFSRAIADVEAMRQHLGLEKIVLWGQSYGAMLAAAYAFKYPAHVAGLLLTSIGPFPGLDLPNDRTKIKPRQATDVGVKLTLHAMLIDLNPRLAEQWIDQSDSRTMWNAVYERSDHRGGGCKDSLEEPEPERMPLGFNLFSGELIEKDFLRMSFNGPQQVLAPTLIIRGECDFVARGAALRYAAVFFPSRVVDVPGAPHQLNTQRHLINAAVSQFVTGELENVP